MINNYTLTHSIQCCVSLKLFKLIGFHSPTENLISITFLCCLFYSPKLSTKTCTPWRDSLISQTSNPNSNTLVISRRRWTNLFTQPTTTETTNKKETQLLGRTKRVRIYPRRAHGNLFFIYVKRSRLDHIYRVIYILLLYV